MKILKISSAKFTYENGAERNRVFLIENIREAPFIRAVTGWKIIGYGAAPWPGTTEGMAAMFEKQTPAQENGGMAGEDFPEGTQIWQHISKWALEEMGFTA